MGLPLSCVCIQAHECTVCRSLVVEGNAGVQLRARLVGKNDPVAVLLALVRGGCCPLCGMTISAGQTPDPVIKRYVRFLEKQARQRRAGV